MKRILRLMTAGIMLFSSVVLAQERTVSGNVTSAEDGQPLPGVSVLVKGTAIGTATDANGSYTLRLPSNSNVLVFSFVGMTSQEIETTGKSTVDVSMEQDATQLSEVVVVGYGTQEREDITGSITRVKGTEIQNLPITSYEQALQGRTPGVQISSSSGELGAAMKIRVRGASSVTANNQPLVVIDGFIVTSQDQTNFTDNNTSNPLADLNPNDIESVDVLKDASAAAIYGSRASNGVILITTKRGSQGKTQFNVNYSTGFSKPTHLRKFLTGPQYAEMFKAASKNAIDPRTVDDVTNPDGSPYSQDDAGWNNAWSDYGGGPESGPGSFSSLVNKKTNDDWNKAAYRTGKISQYDISASGGNDKTKFFTSIGYLDQEAIIIRNSMKRVSARLNIDQIVNSKLKFGLSINQVYSLKNNVAENNQFNSPYESNAIAPIISIKDRNGDYNDSTFYANPFRAIQASKDKSTQWRNFSNLYGSWDIFKGLNFRSEAGIDFLGLYEYGWQGSKFPSNAGTPNFGKYGTSRVINYNVNNTLTYSKDISDMHSLEVLLGQSFQKSVSEFSFMQAQGLPTDDFQYLANAAENVSFSSSQTAFSYTSVFGRVNYKLGNRYLVSASMRNDGSSRFGKSKQYGWFPSASVGWILTEENFIKGLDIGNTINFLKLKTSIGVTGNSEIANFASRGLYTSTYFGNRAGLYPTQLANNDLSWEKTTQWDVGAEFAIVNNRISGGVDYYVKNTKDLLLSLPINSTSGYSSTLRNLGKMTNKGWDIYVNTKNIDGKFKWSTGFNISTYKNEITDLNGQPILPSGRSLNAALVGQPLGVFYGVEWAGVDPATGDALYRLADGTTTTSWTTASQAANLKVVGNPNPKHYGGITNTFSFGGVDLSIFGQWSYGNKIYNSSGVFQSSGFTNFGLDNQTAEMYSYWRKEGDITNVPRPQLDINNGARNTSRYVYDGSYFRFKTVTIGYTIPKSVTDRIKFNTIRIYATGQNILTFTNYVGNDPEVNYTAPSATTQTQNLTNGVDYYSAPQAKSIIFGIKLGF
jgi:TonB-linked SusC/RagA family outer membrane protein